MKLVICGDLSVTKASEQAFTNLDKYAAFGDTLYIFENADRAIVNLECALTESDNRIKKFGPNLKGPKSTADTLLAAGFTDCMLSNNHIFDFGREGARDTLEQLDRVGLGYTGYGENYQSSRQNMYIEKDGVKIAIVNVCEHEYSYATDTREGARPFDEFETMHDIRTAKQNVDHVIVIYHGGKELCRYPSPRLMKACREMVRCGASAVFCQHSHCIGCYEDFEGGHIIYGQGNFHFPMFVDTEMFNEGLIASVELKKHSFSVDYTAVKSTETGIRLATDEESNKIFTEMKKRNDELLDGGWIDGWREFCEQSKGLYRAIMAGKILGREHYTVDDDPDQYQFFAHYLDCESHTDVWREIFKTWNHTNEVD